MTIYSCAPNWEAMLTCIYIARMSGIGHKNLQLMVEPLEQISFLDDYIHVEPDSVMAEKVIEAITRKISPGFYASLAYCSAAYEPETLDTIYRVMLLGFAYGPQALVGVASANIATKVAAGTATGFTAVFGYLSTLVSGIGVGWVAKNWGWQPVLWLLAGAAVCGLVLFATIWNAASDGYGKGGR